MSRTKHTTLDEFIASAWSDDPQYEGLPDVVSAIAEGAKQVRDRIQDAALADVLGATGDINVQGESVQKLDELGSSIFVDVLIASGRVAAVGSEELEDPVLSSDAPAESYIVMMDPVDGSSNIDVAVNIGSIFGIWPTRPGEPVDSETMLRQGRDQTAAVYVVYGSSTILVTATERSVQGFTLDVQTGEFRLTHPDIQSPERCEYYSTNEGNLRRWEASTQRAVSHLRNNYSLRYVGALVADFHRNLLKGGVYLYPADSSNRNGKLRLMYEANPLGFVAEQAGGAASTGTERILDIVPEALHQRTPLVLGNADVVERLESIVAGNGS